MPEIKKLQRQLDEAGSDLAKVMSLDLRLRLAKLEKEIEHEMCLETQAQFIHLPKDRHDYVYFPVFLSPLDSRDITTTLAGSLDLQPGMEPTHLLLSNASYWDLRVDPHFIPAQHLTKTARVKGTIFGLPVMTTPIREDHIRWTLDGEVLWSRITISRR